MTGWAIVQITRFAGIQSESFAPRKATMGGCLLACSHSLAQLLGTGSLSRRERAGVRGRLATRLTKASSVGRFPVPARHHPFISPRWGTEPAVIGWCTNAIFSNHPQGVRMIYRF